MTVYEVIALPPSLAGAVHETSAEALPAEAVTAVGAPGAVSATGPTGAIFQIWAAASRRDGASSAYTSPAASWARPLTFRNPDAYAVGFRPEIAASAS